MSRRLTREYAFGLASPMSEYAGMLYLIGEPGVGKSALTAALVQGRRRLVHRAPFAHTVYEDGLVQLGRERAAFSGTDTLSMSVGPLAIAVLESRSWPRIIAEGDRLAYPKFFEAARALGYELDVVLLEADAETVAARRAARASDQDEKWLAGRRTKLRNLEPYVTRRLDASYPVEALVSQLATHPVLTGKDPHLVDVPRAHSDTSSGAGAEGREAADGRGLQHPHHAQYEDPQA